jgi:hypothetical protein
MCDDSIETRASSSSGRRAAVRIGQPAAGRSTTPAMARPGASKLLLPVSHSFLSRIFSLCSNNFCSTCGLLSLFAFLIALLRRTIHNARTLPEVLSEHHNRYKSHAARQTLSDGLKFEPPPPPRMSEGGLAIRNGFRSKFMNQCRSPTSPAIVD